MTVHWIDPVTLGRKQAVLGLKEVRVGLTGEYLTRAIGNLHLDFGIQNKVKCCISIVLLLNSI